MPGLSITIDDREVQEALGRLVIQAEDQTQAMREIGAAIDTHTMLGFRAGQAPDGTPWAPLSPVTVARRRQGSSSPLRDTGVLQNSFNARADRTSVEYGTADKRAGTHQFGARQGAYGRSSRGGPIPWGDIPARPMIPTGELPESLKREMLRILTRHLSP
ncbi:MAG: phage virion morphogenesis protein [Gammaproteobacteria bacterium]|jgi:phage virion morphogenesis protein|nr:phage virion morphogenesis protein [Gammaproteobacteria bacterium]